MSEAIESNRRPCPICGESIAASTRMCRFCDEVFDPVEAEQVRQEAVAAVKLVAAPALKESRTMFWAVAVLAMGIAFIQGHTAYTELGKMPPLRKFPQFAHPDVPKDFHWPRPGDQQPQKRVIDQRTTLKTAIWINAAVGVLGFCCLFRQVWAAFLLAGWHLIELILCIAYELTAWTIKVDIGMVVLSTTAIVGWVMARRKRRQAMLELML